MECGKRGDRTDGTMKSDRKMRLNDFNLSIKMKMWWNRKVENVSR